MTDETTVAVGVKPADPENAVHQLVDALAKALDGQEHGTVFNALMNVTAGFLMGAPESIRGPVVEAYFKAARETFNRVQADVKARSASLN